LAKAFFDHNMNSCVYKKYRLQQPDFESSIILD